MSFDPHSRRFDPHRLFPAIKTDEEEMNDALGASQVSSYEELTSDLHERDFDLALELIASEGGCVCPLCGASVRSDGSVMS